jgi:N-acetyl-anhydromuramyl-L-alanine amidase AmpD
MIHLLAHCRASLRVLIALACLATTFAALPRAYAQENAPGRLNAAFQHAAKEFDVPRDLLVAIAYAETHLDDHNGEPSIDNGYGLMHLVDNPKVQTLKEAARLLGTTQGALKTDSVQNIRGGAALLRSYANAQGLGELTRKDLTEWYSVVAQYSNASDAAVARFYADEVYKLLNQGFSGHGKHGEMVMVGAEEIKPKRGKYEDAVGIQSTDYGPALWVAASSSNYTVANRETDYPINYVVIHTTQGSYAGAISWFQNPSAKVSAHYVVRSSDGQVTQMVREKDIAWHAGNWTYNTQSIGIEHEGWVNDASWYTDAMYRASAAITRHVALKYGIPMDRSHIIGHNEVPGATHTDPGPHWNWTYYMSLVKQTTTPTWEAIVDNSSANFTASANWGTSTYSTQRYGTDYRYANPEAVSDAAWYKFAVPASANYEVFVWYAANSGYNSAAPYVIATSSGNKSVLVDQRINGGKWVSLGTHALNAGTYNAVGVSRWTSGTGLIIADAVKLVRR